MLSIPPAHEQLSQEHYYLLSLAAMFEGQFTLDWLEELTGMKASFILSVLEEETQNGLLNRIKPAVYSFKKNKRQKWIKRFSSEEKVQFHRNIAAILIRELSEEETIILEIAQHLLHIPNNLLECQWLMKAGEIYAGQLINENSSTCFRHVIDSLSTQHGENEDLLYIKAAICLSNCFGGRNQIETNLSVLREARERSRRRDRHSAVLLLEMHIAKHERLNSEFNKSFKRFNNAYKQINRINDPEVTTSVASINISFLFWQGYYHEVIDIYEKTVPEVSKLPIGYYPVLVATMVGHAYAMVGQVTQGLGMLDAIHSYCLEQKNTFLSAHASSTIAIVMLAINNSEDSLRYLKLSLQEAENSNNTWVKALVTLMLCIIYHKKKDQKEALKYLRLFLKCRDKVNANLLLMPYLLELGWLIKKGDFPDANEISIENVIARLLKLKNCFIRGIAYRYQALLDILNELPNKQVTRSLALSSMWLKKSGYKIECAKTNFETARHFLSIRKHNKAKTVTEMAAKILTSHDMDLIPDDLRPLIGHRNHEGDVLAEIVRMADHVAAKIDRRKLLQHIITTANRLTGAERGAILLLEKEQNASLLNLRASKNFTIEQFYDTKFDSGRKMIHEVLQSGNGCISENNLVDPAEQDSKDTIRSSICVPLTFKNRIIGVLYHDNRLLGNVFKESDLKLLTFFASLASLGLDCECAHEEIERLNQKLNDDKFFRPCDYKQSHHIEGLIGESPVFKNIMTQIDQVGKTDTAILLTGETGVGKNFIARIIHDNSQRAKADFVTVQCSALTESLITSELFGHEKGAFTGAINRQIGRFEMADGGTLFLDEIGDLPLEVQARLLRVLQSKEFERVGGGKQILTSNFRLITATNRNLYQEVEAKRFREDLLYRINVFPIHIPPLRERRDDIPLLVHHFLNICNERHGRCHDKIPQEVMDKLIHHDWPGNIRELENVIHRGVITSREPYFQLPPLIVNQPTNNQSNEFRSLMENERKHIEEALRRTGGKIHGPSGAAEILKVNPSTLTSRIKKLGIKKSKKVP